MARTFLLVVAVVLSFDLLLADDPPKPKKKELLVVSLYKNDAEGNTAILQSGEALKKEMTPNYDVHLVKMGPGKTKEKPANGDPSINSIDDLKAWVLKTHGKLDSIHFLGHGTPGKAWFPGNPKDTKINFGNEPDSATVQNWSYQEFADLLDSILNDDAKIYFETCHSATGDESLAQKIADATGRTTYGHTKEVIFRTDKPPTPEPGGAREGKDPKPDVTYDGGRDVEEGGKKVGMTYFWSINPHTVEKICDIHIEIPAGLDANKFENWKVTVDGKEVVGWTGASNTANGKTWLNWYTTDCEKHQLKGEFAVQVDYKDAGASDDEIPEKKFTTKLTNDGSSTVKKDNSNVPFGGTGSSSGPKFTIALGDVDQNGEVNQNDLLALEVMLANTDPSEACCCGPDRPVYLANTDLNCDGCVNQEDLAILQQAVTSQQAPQPCRPFGDLLLEARVQDAIERIDGCFDAYAEYMTSLAAGQDAGRDVAFEVANTLLPAARRSPSRRADRLSELIPLLGAVAKASVSAKHTLLMLSVEFLAAFFELPTLPEATRAVDDVVATTHAGIDELVDRLLAAQPNRTSIADPGFPAYGLHAIRPDSWPGVVGVQADIEVTAFNYGGSDATGAEVELSYNDWGVTYQGWQPIGIMPYDVAAGGNAQQTFSHTFGTRAHVCLQAVVVGAGSGGNADASNDRTQINWEVVHADEDYDMWIPFGNAADEDIVVRGTEVLCIMDGQPVPCFGVGDADPRPVLEDAPGMDGRRDVLRANEEVVALLHAPTIPDGGMTLVVTALMGEERNHVMVHVVKSSVAALLNAPHLCCLRSVRLRVLLESLLADALAAFEAGDCRRALRLLRLFVQKAILLECDLSDAEVACIEQALLKAVDAGIMVARALGSSPSKTASLRESHFFRRAGLYEAALLQAAKAC